MGDTRRVLVEVVSEESSPADRWSAALARIRRAAGKVARAGAPPAPAQPAPPTSASVITVTPLPLRTGLATVAAEIPHPDSWSDLRDPGAGAESASQPLLPPLVTFRAPGGVLFWHAAMAADDRVALDGSIRRVFVIRRRDGDRRCSVEMAPAVRDQVAAEAGCDLHAEDGLWDMLGRAALTEVLCGNAALPPAVVTVRRLAPRQIEILQRARPARRPVRLEELLRGDSSSWFPQGE